nr:MULTISPECIES: hypothetical protein [Nostocales]
MLYYGQRNLNCDRSWRSKLKTGRPGKLSVVGEHINRKLKIFKILSDRYRNRRKRFGLRFNLIAGLYNYELRLPKTEST